MNKKLENGLREDLGAVSTEQFLWALRKNPLQKPSVLFFHAEVRFLGKRMFDLGLVILGHRGCDALNNGPTEPETQSKRRDRYWAFDKKEKRMLG